MQRQSSPPVHVLEKQDRYYDLTRASLKLVEVTGKKYPNVPSKRYEHTCVVYQDQMYVLGGVDNEEILKQCRIYILNLRNMSWSTMQTNNIYCEGRNAHACTVHQHQIYFFGGIQNQTGPNNHFFKFNPNSQLWKFIDYDDVIPEPRQIPLFTSCSNRYILLYGGINTNQNKLLNDAFLYKDQKWLEIEIVQNISERIRMGVALCQSKIFVFGGQGPSQQQIELFDTLYQICLQENNKNKYKMSFIQIEIKHGKKPQKRTSHGMVGLSSRYLLMCGGQGLSNEGQQNLIALNDIWMFDYYEIVWFQIEIKNNNAKGLYQFSLVSYNNQLIIFGGYNGQDQVSEQCYKIKFNQFNNKLESLCRKCQDQIQQHLDNQQLHVHLCNVSTGFLYNVALLIKFPFKAIQLIIDSLESIGSSYVKVITSKNKDQFDYITFDFQINKNIQQKQFFNFWENILIGSFRLGKLILFISVTDGIRSVRLTAVDNRFQPNFQQMFNQLYYIENINKNTILDQSSFKTKSLIFNILSTQLSQPYQILSKKQGHSLHIFQTNVYLTTGKLCFYSLELVGYYAPQNDLKIFHNQKKMQFLDNIGYKLTNSPQFSLKSYLSLSRIQRKIEVYLNNNETYIKIKNYQKILSDYKDRRLIKKIYQNKNKSLISKIKIYQCNNQNFIEQNHGILIYCSNALFNRYQIPFGELIQNKFNKKKYSKRQNIFKFLGIIILSQQVLLNRPGDKFKIKRYYNIVLEELQKIISSYKTNKDISQKKMQQLYELRFSLPTKKTKTQTNS